MTITTQRRGKGIIPIGTKFLNTAQIKLVLIQTQLLLMFEASLNFVYKTLSQNKTNTAGDMAHW